jgi:imidazolonepropionase-like amidohydrolase
MSRNEAARIVERARSHGLRTVVHIGTTEDAIDAGHAGVALWVHGVYKESIPDEQIAVLAGFGIPMVTTSEVFDSYGRARRGPIVPTRLERETVPAEVLASFYPPPADLDLGPLEDWLRLMEQTREVRLDNVARLHRTGITILAGSDVQPGVFPGASLHRELRTLVEAGLTPVEAIRAATLLPARFLDEGEDPDFGVVAIGRRADLLLVDGDPTADIQVLEAIREVILAGVPIERIAVDSVDRVDATPSARRNPDPARRP